MKLILIRHALAKGKYSENIEDYSRELSKKGKSKFKKITSSLKKLEPNVDVIFTSPLLRAIETAELIYATYPKADFELVTDLDLHDKPAHLVEFISFLPFEGTYVFVGHEPHMSSVIAALLSLHPEHQFMELKKGGMCILEGGVWQGFEMKLLVSPNALEIIS